MAKTAQKHVSASIPVDLYETLNDYRWEQKIDKFTDVIREALTVFAQDNLDYVPADTEPQPAP